MSHAYPFTPSVSLTDPVVATLLHKGARERYYALVNFEVVLLNLLQWGWETKGNK